MISGSKVLTAYPYGFTRVGNPVLIVDARHPRYTPCGLDSTSHQASTEDEEDRAEQAESCEEVVEGETLFEVQDREGRENCQGDDLLHDLELSDAEDLVTDTVRRDLEQVFEQGNTPGDQGGDEPGPVSKISQVGIPGEGHEDVGNDQEDDGCHKK